MLSTCKCLSRLALVALAATVLAHTAGAAPLVPNPDLDLAGQGLSVAEAGVGLNDLGSGLATIEIEIGGPVSKAFLYWSGRDRPCPVDTVLGDCVIPAEPYKDQELLFDGEPIAGTIIGTETQFPAQNNNNIGYRADVTGLVADRVTVDGIGVLEFTVEDGDLSNNFRPGRLTGAGLLVVFTDASDDTIYRLAAFDGMDFAFCRSDQIPEAQVTTAVDFGYTATPFARSGDLILFVGDGSEPRPDRIDITDSAGVTELFDLLAGADGPAWDTLGVTVDLPAFGDETSVQLFSKPQPENPDSLLWQLAALRIPLDIAIDIRKQAEGEDSRTVASGADVDFEIEVTNTGSEDLDDVEVTDALVPGCDNVIGFLAAGDSVTYTCTAFDVVQGFTNIAAASGQAFGVTVADEDPSTVVVEGGQGCTPGYWKQRHHADSWTGFDPGDDYSLVFGVAASFDKDLLGALKQGGGGEKALGRHAVAALLNAASGDVAYAFSVAAVIAIVQDAYGSGELEAAKDLLEAENEGGCPLN